MDGTSGSTTITDSSPSPKTVTSYSSASILNDPYKFGGGSVVFNGANYVSTVDSTDWTMGSSDFTIDFWMKRYGSMSTAQYVFGQANSTNTATTASFYGYIHTDNLLKFGFTSGSTQYLAVSSNPITDTNWHHIALVRSTNTMKLYIDGLASGSVDVTGISMNDSSNTLSIGRIGEYTSYYFNGYIDEFRVSKGIARWTTNFTTPNQPYPLNKNGLSILSGNVGIGTASAESLLTLNGASPDLRIINSSDSGYFRASKDFSLNKLSFYNTITDVKTKLLLHMDGANDSVVFSDSSQYNKTITVMGGAKISSAQSKFGGTSLALDGTGDFLSLADSDDWAFGTENFTIDFWLRMNTVSSSQYIFAQIQDANNELQMYYNSTLGLRVWWYQGGSFAMQMQQSSTAGWAANTWYHIAVVRNGNDFNLYRDGTSILSTTSSASLSNFTNSFSIGSYNGVYFTNGYIDEFRISKGIARWTSNFTPPTYAYFSPGYNSLFLSSSDSSDSSEKGLTTIGDKDGGILLQAKSIKFNIDTTEKIRLTSTGLGIGTTSPYFTLDINGNTRIQGSNYLYFGGSGSSDNDTNLYRGGSNLLQTDDIFKAGGYQTTDGATSWTGISGTITTRSSIDGAQCSILVTNGLVTGGTCPGI